MPVQNILIQTKWSEQAEQAHSVLWAVEKMWYKKILLIPV